MVSKAAASEISPLGEHQLFFVEIKIAFFANINHVGSEEELQGILPVVTSGEHPLEYGPGSKPKLFNCLGILCAGGIVLPECLDYFGDRAHHQPVGQKNDRQNEQYDYQDNEQNALRIHKQITPIYRLLSALTLI